MSEIIYLNDHREWDLTALICLECYEVWQEEVPRVRNASSIPSCGCGSKRIVIVRGEVETIEISPDVFKFEEE